jgi:hypothetical protein
MTTADTAERHLLVTSRHGWFSRGQERLPRGMRQSSFADGQARHDYLHHGRFCAGQQRLQVTDQNEVEGTFADR